MEDPTRAHRPVTVLICDDHRAVADAVGFVISSSDGIELAADPVDDPEEAVELTARLVPDVVLMDVELHAAVDGIEATRRIRQQTPSTRVIIFTASEDVTLLVYAVEAGAAGIVRKYEPIDRIVSAIVAAARGEVLVDADELARLLREVAAQRAGSRSVRLLLDSLTKREAEVLQLLGEGMANDEMARRLFISTSTAQTHVRNILAKFNVGSRLEAVVLAARHGRITVR